MKEEMCISGLKWCASYSTSNVHLQLSIKTINSTRNNFLCIEAHSVNLYRGGGRMHR